ncbi:MAG: bifunctional N(6)-L-threonylcarbamoyladenine synthase/serine/threonine protein kinase [Minisyncoccales bacterium]
MQEKNKKNSNKNKKNKGKYCLGIESTAHTFGASIASFDGKILSNIKDTFTTKSGGIIPYKAANHHVDLSQQIIQKALKKAKLKISDISLISFSQSPGLGHTLRIGAMAARSLARIHNIDLIGVNHCIAHLEIGRLLTNAKDPVLLYLSGANTQVIAYEGKKYRIFGETLDIGIGNFLDSFAREIGFGFPGGPKIYQESLNAIESAKKNSKNKKNKPHYIKLPYVVKGMDVSFGGILTNLKQKYNSGKYSKQDLCYSCQETVFAMMVEVAERALAHCDKQELLLGGGVACNKRLYQMCKIMCEQRNAKVYILKPEYLVDNAAMISWLGILMYNAGNKTKIKDSDIDPYKRTDEIIVNWRDD